MAGSPILICARTGRPGCLLRIPHGVGTECCTTQGKRNLFPLPCATQQLSQKGLVRAVPAKSLMQLRGAQGKPTELGVWIWPTLARPVPLPSLGRSAHSQPSLALFHLPPAPPTPCASLPSTGLGTGVGKTLHICAPSVLSHLEHALWFIVTPGRHRRLVLTLKSG